MKSIAQGKNWIGISEYLLDKTPAVSQQSKAIDESSKEAILHATGPISLRPLKHEAYEYLLNIADDCQLDNWDGDGAKAISSSVVHSTWKFLRILPDRQLPEIEADADADGEISLSWYKGADDVFTVSVGKNSRIAFAGLFGESECRGQEQFENEKIPHSVASYIERIC